MDTSHSPEADEKVKKSPVLEDEEGLDDQEEQQENEINLVQINGSGTREEQNFGNDTLENGPTELIDEPAADDLVDLEQQEVEEENNENKTQEEEEGIVEVEEIIEIVNTQTETPEQANTEQGESEIAVIGEGEAVTHIESENQEDMQDVEENDQKLDPRRHVHVEGTNVSTGHEGEIDNEGYRIDQHQETEHFSHTREIRELEDHMEIVQQDSRCLQLEEVKTKETIRQATAEELKTLLEATIFDGKDEVEIGTEIVVEGFTRVEQTHEETDAGGVTSRNVTVTETRQKEEVHEDPNQSPLPPIEGNAPTNEEYTIQLEHTTGCSIPAITDGKIEKEQHKAESETKAEPQSLTNNEPTNQDQSVSAETNKTKEETKEEVTKNNVVEEKPEKKSKGIVGYIKERSRSLSRNRSETIIKDDATGEKTKKKKKWSFLSKSDSKKGLDRQSRADENDAKPPTGQTNLEDSKNKPHGSAEDILKDKKKLKHRKLSFFAKQKDNITDGNQSGTNSGCSTLEREPSSGGEETRSRSWSLFRRKSDRRKDTPEKKEGLETSKSEHSAIGSAEAKRKHSTNSLQRGVKNLFSGKKESVEDTNQVDGVETCQVQIQTNLEPQSKSNKGQQALRRASVNSVNTTAVSAGYSAVVAIDLGATVSSYAFSFTHESPDIIYTMRKPEGSDPGICDPKFPTALLINPEGEFHSFGFTARNVYQALDPAEAEKWMYFDSFRKQLTQIWDISGEPILKASNGLSAPAEVLLEHALKFLSFEAMQDLDTYQNGEPVGKVRWVVTAPAGWHSEARQWIRHIACKVGLATADFPQQLLVMQESQAAAVCVQKLQLAEWLVEYEQQVLHQKKKQEADEERDQPVQLQDPILKSASVSMIVNCGGDELTVSVYEIKEAAMTLLYQNISTNSGGTGVNDAFVKLLHKLFGEEFVEDYKSKKPSGWADLIVAFESCKRSLDPVKGNPLNVPLPFSFIDHHLRHFGYDVDVSIEKNGEDKDIIWTQQGMLRLYSPAWINLFQPLLDKILQAVRQAIVSSSGSNIEYVWLIGGFSECLTLQKAIRDSFKQLKIIIPKETSHVAVKGAVNFGIDPVRITFSQADRVTR